MPITCDCVPTPREFSYGNSTPEIPVGDLRTKIENREYYQDQTISDMILPRCLSIGSEGFRESSITSIDAPQCKTIGSYAFYGCNSLSPDMDFSSAETVGSYAFADTHNMRGGGIIDLSSAKVIKQYAFYKYHYNFADRSTPTYILMPNVETIEDFAFRDAGYNIKYINDELNLPKCKSIGKQAFRPEYAGWEHEIKKIYLPSIISIDNYAFRSVDYLEEVHLGPNCQTLGSDIFMGAGNSWRLYVEAVTPPTLGSLGESVTIYVPEQSVNTYKSAAGWSQYASNIYPIPTE